jgi:hypothetical protein
MFTSWRAGWLPVWQAKVVGRDDLGELGDDLPDGDIVLAVRQGRQGSCPPGTVFVDEGADEVSVVKWRAGRQAGRGVTPDACSRPARPPAPR